MAMERGGTSGEAAPDSPAADGNGASSQDPQDDPEPQPEPIHSQYGKSGQHLLRHALTADAHAAALECLGPDPVAAGHAIWRLRQPELRSMFGRIFGVETHSGNNCWMRGKLLQALGLSKSWAPEPEAGAEVEEKQPAAVAEAEQQLPNGGADGGDGHSLRQSTRRRQLPAYLQQELEGAAEVEEAGAEEEAEGRRPAKKRRAGAAAHSTKAGGSKLGQQQVPAPPLASPPSPALEPPPSGVVVLMHGRGDELPPWDAQQLAGGDGGVAQAWQQAQQQAQEQQEQQQFQQALPQFQQFQLVPPPPQQFLPQQYQQAPQLEQLQLQQLLLQQHAAQQQLETIQQMVLLQQQELGQQQQQRQRQQQCGSVEQATMVMLRALGVLPHSAGALQPAMPGPPLAAASPRMQPGLPGMLQRQVDGCSWPVLAPGDPTRAFEDAAAAAAAAAQPRTARQPGSATSTTAPPLARHQQQQPLPAPAQGLRGAALQAIKLEQQPGPAPASPRAVKLEPQVAQLEQFLSPDAASLARWRCAGLSDSCRLPSPTLSPFAELAAVQLPFAHRPPLPPGAHQAAAAAAAAGGGGLGVQPSFAADLKALEAMGWSAALPSLSGDLHNLYKDWLDGRVSVSLPPNFHADNGVAA